MTEADYQAAAAKLGVPIAAVKAVAEVESSGETFWTIDELRLPPIRLEAHHFGRLTGYRYNDSHPHISSREWNRSLAATTHEGAWRQFKEAALLDYRAAIQATSWGAYQVMGFNWQELGYPNPDALERAAYSDGGQLDMFVRYIKANVVLVDAMRRQDWHIFAAGYNGPGAVDEYAPKMAAAYARHSGEPRMLKLGDSGPDVADLQRALGIAADGDFGPRTDAAVRKLQADYGLTIDGIVGPQTRNLLERIAA